MKKRIGIKIILPIIIAAIVIVPMFVLGKDYIAEYDKLFGNGEITINTNEISVGNVDSYQLWDAVYNAISRYNSPAVHEGGIQYNYRPSVSECDNSNMTCDIIIYEDSFDGTTSYSEEIKKYEDVSININSEVSSYFEDLLDENGNMVIRYDETLFANEDEKNQYINNFITNKQYNNEYGWNVSYSYDSYYNILTYSVIDYSNYNFENYFVARIAINGVVFDDTEEPYSDSFKILSEDGNLTIKTNGDITVSMLSQHLNNFYAYTVNGSVHFSVDGNIVDNKVYVVMVEQDNDYNKIREEKHLINLIKDSNIDREIFASIGLDGKINIAALEPDFDLSNYINNYMNALQTRNINVDDDTYYYFSYISPYDGSNKHFIKMEKYDNGKIVDIQFNEITFDFVGYSNLYSAQFEEKYKDGVVVRSDEKTSWSVSSNLEYGYYVLSCNDDVSVCDIGLYHVETNSLEIHKVNVTFDDSVSEKFKRLFGIKEDGTIDIISDVELEEHVYFSYYSYDNATDTSLQYYRQGDMMQLTMNAYSGEGYEKHSVYYNIVDREPTASYLNRVDLNKDFYPGENTNVWNQLTWNGYFSKNLRSSYSVNTISCDRSTKKCKVITLNDDNVLEIHEATANIKEGKSPEFNASFPNKKVVFNAIYKDDETYLYGASMAYFMSKTKEYVYLRDFTEDTAKVVFNELEIHSFDVEYMKANEKHAKEVAKAKEKLEKVKLSTLRKDLEFVNKFYYSSDNFFSSDNFNSKSLNDKFNKAVNNKHIGYYVVPEGGGGMPYLDGAEGRLVLFYDGVAYDILDDYVDFTNHNIIYIPTDTEKTPEAYVAAAQARIDEYLGSDSGVVVSYIGALDDDMKDFFKDGGYETFGIDKNTFDHNAYQLTYLEKTSDVLIVADSSKMQKPDFAASDVTANINVTSNNVNYPSNTVVMSEVIDKEDSEYSKILEKAKIKNAYIVDINLYSSTVGDIKDFEGANFDVSVPVEDSNLVGKDLVAYYIKDNGEVETHDIVMDDFVANFETTHFSTYIIAEKSVEDKIEDAAEDIIKNPNTVDNVLTSIMLMIISGFGIGIYCYNFVKKEN